MKQSKKSNKKKSKKAPSMEESFMELLKQYAYGGTVSAQHGNSTVRNYIETPDEAMRENDLAKARAYEEAAGNELTQGLDIFGNMAVQMGSSMMSSGGGMANGGTVGEKKPKYFFGGDVPAGTGGGNAAGAGGGGVMNYAGGLSSIASMLPMIASMFGPSGFALGGQVQGAPGEIEGGEVLETPSGEVAKVEGPSHAKGGIPINTPNGMDVPGGTEVYSKKLKGPDGKSLADRKMKREKKLAKLDKLFKVNPKDKALRKAVERTQAANDRQEQQDQQQMQFAREQEQAKASFALGGQVDPNNPFASLFQELHTSQQRQNGVQVDQGAVIGRETQETYGQNIPVSGMKTMGTDTTPTGGLIPTTNKEGVSGTMNGEVPANKGGGLKLTGGDAISLAGNIMAMNNSSKHAKKMAANKIENKDFHKDFGNDALERIDQSKGYVEQQKAFAMKQLEDARTGVTTKVRNASRGVNDLKGGDLAAFAQTNKAQGGISDNFSKQMMQLFQQQAGLENQQDTVVMNSAKQKHLEDQQDRGAELSANAQAGADKATGMQHLGKNVNQLYENRATGNAMNKISANYQADPQTGRVTFKDQASVDANPEFKGLDTNTAGVLADASNKGIITFNPEKNTWTMGNKEYTRDELITQMGNE